MRWLYVFMVFFHCLWILKERADVCKWVYRLGRGSWERLMAVMNYVYWECKVPMARCTPIIG